MLTLSILADQRPLFTPERFRRGGVASSSPARHPRSGTRSSASATRSSSPSRTQKRPRSPQSSDSEDPPSQTDSPQSKTKQKKKAKRTKPKQKDYEGDSYNVIVRASLGFKVRIGTEGAITDDADTLRLIATQCFEEADKYYNAHLKFSGPFATVIMHRGSQLRGSAKTAAKSHIIACYGIKDGDEPGDSEFNEALIRRLKEKEAYVWAKSPTELDVGKGLYQHRIIGHIITAIFFSGRKKERLALLFPTPFNPIPIPAMALACTAVECALDEWKTGRHVPVEFKVGDYKNVYDRHIAKINSLKQNRPARMAEMQERLYEKGRARAGIPVDVQKVAQELGEDEYAADD
ncbi:hypothetical protein SISSUDRAFT_1036234 [Sistotremastrum suecicum HHB10207 ss-3]|uniref:DUF6532 domain-containing protein n=1 Tax=Sistotremastrum suecicum HHB10207 ss-3 TaxID=1314776 RepID=A0A165ZP10_9AGAM|nr:hypothetical protein SISSUDRAFT_1036234 [Sistotremastrum suecicum HHB10207 ss-3]